jgi:Glycosyltransferase family 87
MSAIPPSFGPRARGLLCGAVLAGYSVFVVAPACRHPNTNGFAAYYTASRILLETPRELRRAYDNPWFQERIDAFGFARVRDIYNIQPPTMSLMLVPIAWMSPARARIVWVICSVVLWWSGLALLVKTFARNGGGLVAPWVRLAALTTAYISLADNFRQGQCYALLFFLLCAVLYLAQHPNPRRTWLAGVPLGVMLVLKMAGLLNVNYIHPRASITSPHS